MSLFGSIASVAGSVIGAGASYLGSQAQAKAAGQAADQSYAIYQQQRKDAAPYRKIGGQALNQLRDVYLTGKTPFTASPGYDWRVSQGTQALERGASARGRQFSGAQGKALTEYGQGVATDEYNQNFNRLSSLAGYGGQALAANNTAGNQFSTNYGNAIQNAGSARSSGYQGIGSSINSGVNNLLFLRSSQGGY